MRNRSFLLFLFIWVISARVNAQIDTTDFFPIQTGNYWEYKARTLYGYSDRSITVLGDTIMPNGKLYTHFLEKYSGVDGVNTIGYIDWYYRKDSNRVYIYTWDTSRCNTNEYLHLNFDSRLKDSTVWEVCRRGSAGNARGLARTFYDYRYFNWFQRPVETKIFDDVKIDSYNSVIWLPTDASLQIALLKGMGMVYKIIFGVGEYFLQGAIINGVKYGELTSVEDKRIITPNSLNITAFPNPFNPSTTIFYKIPNETDVELRVYDMLGREISTLVNEEQTAGDYKVQFDASSLPSGVYIYTIQAGSFRDSKKLILLK